MSYLDCFSRILGGFELVGCHLDFLLQVMDREVNTMGLKIQNLEIIGLGLEFEGSIRKTA
ncbi:MAG: DUF1732 domain-containing protein [Candidatus Adiutrix intracellularis]|nr:DUF1732 domain-containing protein [Candidatus Adiutrix intracellularis]